MTNKPDLSTTPTVTNKLLHDVEIEGTLRFTGSLEFDGKLKGDVQSDGILIIGKNGVVEGDIKTDTTIIFGLAGGSIETIARCELKSSGSVKGDITTSLFSMEEGAEFEGTLKTRKNR